MFAWCELGNRYGVYFHGAGRVEPLQQQQRLQQASEGAWTADLVMLVGQSEKSWADTAPCVHLKSASVVRCISKGSQVLMLALMGKQEQPISSLPCGNFHHA